MLITRNLQLWWVKSSDFQSIYVHSISYDGMLFVAGILVCLCSDRVMLTRGVVADGGPTVDDDKLGTILDNTVGSIQSLYKAVRV